VFILVHRVVYIVPWIELPALILGICKKWCIPAPWKLRVSARFLDSTMSAVDVLIVGAGPTGLALALELAAERIPFRIIDKASEASKLSRGLTIQVIHVLRLHLTGLRD